MTILVFSCMGLNPPIALAAVEEPPIECLTVSKPRILAGELATQDSRFAQLPVDADLGYTPDPGRWREIRVPPAQSPADEIRDARNLRTDLPAASRRLPARDPRTSHPVLKRARKPTSGATVCVMRRLRPLSVDKLRDALDVALPAGAELGSWEILAHSEGQFPDGVITFSRSGMIPPTKGSNEVLWRGALRYEAGRSASIWVKLRFRGGVDCLRAKEALRRGQALDAAQVEFAPCDAVAVLSGALRRADSTTQKSEDDEAKDQGQGGIADRKSLDGTSVLGRDLPAGSWLLPEHFTAVPTLRRGERVHLMVRSGAVMLTIPAEVEQAASLGELVWVRRLRDRRRIRAQVIGPGKVLLEAGAGTPVPHAVGGPSSTTAFPAMTEADKVFPQSRVVRKPKGA